MTKLGKRLKTAGCVAAMGLAAGISAAQAATVNLEVDSVLSEIKGSTAAVTGSGSKDNTTTWNIGDSARFGLAGDDGTPDQTPVSYGLDVEIISATGTLTEGTDSLMIAQTVNSQGLTDTGSLSIYFNPDNDGVFSATLRFSLFDDSFSSAQFLDLFATSLDIDFDQKMSTTRADVAAYGLNNPTDIGLEDDGTRITFSGDGSAEFSDPRAAVLLEYENTSTFDLTFSHDSVALYMLEFRNPPETVDIVDFETTSTVSTVPLPAAGWMLLAGTGALFAARRRRRG